jgi:hypothetical protein
MPTLWSEDEAKAAIKKFAAIIDMANTAGANITQPKAALHKAIRHFNAGNMNYVFSSIVETRAKLNESVNELGGKPHPSHHRAVVYLDRVVRYLRPKIKFVFPMYGLWPLGTGIVFFAIYVALLWWWPLLSQNNLHLRHLDFGIPMWVALVAGIGASVQIMVDVTNDVKTNGYVQKYRRIWYMLLPIVGPVFGILAYILLLLGFLSLSGVTAQQLGKQTFSAVLVCFLAGYSTEWFMRVLGKLTG